MAPDDIKKVTLQYCKDNLKKKEKAECFDVDEKVKKDLHRIRMNEKDSDGFEITKEDFDDVLAKFQRKTTKVYDFLLKADDEYKDAIFCLCKKFIDEEQFPDIFKETLLYMILKRKGSAQTLKNKSQSKL